MKICTSIFLSLFIFKLSLAQEIDSLFIKADFQNASLPEILSDLETHQPIRFFYKDEWIPDQTFNISFEDESLIFNYTYTLDFQTHSY